MKRNTGIVYIVVAVLALISSAHAENGEIRGTVIDRSTGNAVEGARISLRAALMTLSAESRGGGHFVVGGVPEGTDYCVRAEKNGFKAGEAKATVVRGGTDTITLYLESRYLKLKSPVGGEAIFAGSWVPILWESEGVKTITIEFSINSGKDWRLLAKSVDASTGRYTWDVDDIPSARYRIRISDENDPGLQDASHADFGNTSI